MKTTVTHYAVAYIDTGGKVVVRYPPFRVAQLRRMMPQLIDEDGRKFIAVPVQLARELVTGWNGEIRAGFTGGALSQVDRDRLSRTRYGLGRFV